MKKNKFQNISSDELDKLVNHTFLNLDFNRPVNQQLLQSISSHVLVKTTLFSAVNKLNFSKILLLTTASVIIFGTIFYTSMLKPSNHSPVLKVETSEKPLHVNNFAIEKPIVVAKNESRVKNNVTKPQNIKKEVSVIEYQENIMLRGYVKRAKDGESLPGVVIYKQNSTISTVSDSQGYYTLQLPKGENIIVVSLTGYQTYSFSAFSEENISKDIELKEVWKLLDEVTVKPEGYIFPNLTEKQKRANEKEKQNMVKAACRVRPGKNLKYSLIPAPSNSSFLPFYMASGEVTNLEYRTFLFDLLINGKKEEFLIAKPEQNKWINAGGVHFFDTLSHIYFSDKKYNTHPVVNITRAGAEMYCRWLEKLVNEIRQNENKKTIEVRLPYEHEWLYAASGGHPNATYPWPEDSIQNHVNWFLANCCIQKLTDKLKYPLGHTRKSDLNAYTSAGMVMGNNSIATVDVFAYNPNDFYLYTMSGNVSEMVYLNDKKNIKTKGGNWNSDFEHLKLNSEDEFKDNVKPSPMIGFRICVVEKK